MSARPPRRFRKYLVLSGLGGLFLLFVAIVALAVILYTQTGSRFALSRALVWYNGTIAGSAEMKSFHGCLGSRLELFGVVVKDAKERPLVEAGHISLIWKPWALVTGNLSASKIYLKDVTLHVYRGAPINSFVDLAPNFELTSKRVTREGVRNFGPNLPLRIDAELDVRNFSLIVTRADGESEQAVSGADFVGTVSGVGRSVKLIVAAIEGRSPFLKLDVHSLALNATWDAPIVRVEQLKLKSNYGDALVYFAQLDVSNFQASAKVEGKTSDQSTLLATIEGRIHNSVDLGAELTLSNLKPSSYVNMRASEVSGRGEVHLKGPDYKSANIEGTFRCDQCTIWPAGPIDGEVAVHFVNGAGELRASFQAAKLELKGRAAFADWRPRAISWQARSKDLSASSAILAKTMKSPLVSGSLKASGTCEAFGAKPLRCEGNLYARNLRSLGQKIDSLKIGAHGNSDRVEIRAQAWRGTDQRIKTRLAVRPGPPLVIYLKELFVQRGELATRLLQPAKIEVDKSGFKVDALSLAINGGRLKVKGRFSRLKENKIDIELDELNLGHVTTLFPWLHLEGSLSARAHLAGKLHAPRSFIQAETRKLKYNNTYLGDTKWAADYRDRQLDAELSVTGGLARHLKVRGTFPLQIDRHGGVRWLVKEHHELDVEAAGIGFNSIIDLLPVRIREFPIFAQPLQGEANLRAHLSGRPAAPDLNIYTDFKDLRVGSRRIGDGAIGIKVSRNVVDGHAQITQGSARYADLKVTFPFRVELEKARIDWQSEKEYRLTLLVDGIDEGLIAPFAALPAGVTFRFKGSCTGAGTFKKFLLNAKYQGVFQQEGFASTLITGELSANQAKQFAKITIGPETKPHMHIRLNTEWSSSASTKDSLGIKNTPFKTRIDVPGLELALIAPLLPSALYEIAGTIKGQINATGTIGNPSIQGRLELNDGAVTIAALNQRLKKVGFVVSLDKTHVRIDKLRFASGKGRGKGSFEIPSMENGRWVGQGSLQLQRFPFVKPGLPEGFINTKISARIGRAPDRTDIELKIEDTDVRLFTRTSSRVPKKVEEPTNIIFVDRRGRTARSKQPSGTKAPPPNRELRLAIDMTDPVELSGSGVDMRWAGKVSLLSSQGKNEARGEIRALPGRFQLLANSFEIESGELTLPANGELDPFINILAHTTTAEAEVTVAVRGRASRPELILTADPPMSQYQIVSLLVTGRSDTADRTNESVQSEAASLLLAFQNPLLERQLYSRLGLDRVDVALGTSVEEPILVVGKRLGKRWYVETVYHHNAPENENTAGARIEYQLSPSWTLETVYGDANKGEVGIYWRKRFDRAIENNNTHGKPK